MSKRAIEHHRSENFSAWYQDVIKASDLAENSPVRGCMIIKPHGQALWERFQKELDQRFKALDVENVYFPLLIPLSYLEKEAQHVEGFAKECAVVTHRRLVQDDKGGLRPDGELTEPYVIRPTSEMVIGDAFSKWIHSHRDLPMKINQWANVMRWEMRPRLFLRTAEFLWQEGHTVHATRDEARNFALHMLKTYAEFAKDVLAIQVIEGVKPPSETFPGADETYSIEAIMQDGKALQAGTSHFLGQNFSKAQNISFLDDQNTEQHAWTTSWGVSTRLIGALIMSHSDDMGLVLPPKIAPNQILIHPMIRQNKEQVMAKVHEIKSHLESLQFDGENLRVEILKEQLQKPGSYWTAYKKGYPLIIEIGPRDLENDQVMVTQRVFVDQKKEALALSDFIAKAPELLKASQEELLKRSQKRVNSSIKSIDNLEELKKFATSKDQAWGRVYLDDVNEVRDFLKEHQLTLRVFTGEKDLGECLITGKKVSSLYIAQAY